MSRPLALSLRPQKLSQIIGNESVVNVIRKQYKSKREPPAWLFVGKTGTGKTTVARILALSVQCTHGEFGEPCDNCLKEMSSFAIKEINASEISGVEAIGDVAQSSEYLPIPPSRRSVIILDEAQRLSTAAQNLLLKYLENAPDTTIWIICTTEQNKILQTLRRRCQVMEMKGLQADAIERLIKRAYKFLGGEDLPKMIKLVDAINAEGIQSPALILNAVERYVAGQSAKSAVKFLVTGHDSGAICAAMRTGDWNGIRKQIKEASSDELRGVRASVASYLKEALLETTPGVRAKELALAIDKLSKVDSYSDVTQGPATVAMLYELSQLLGGAQSSESLAEEYVP